MLAQPLDLADDLLPCLQCSPTLSRVPQNDSLLSNVRRDGGWLKIPVMERLKRCGYLEWQWVAYVALCALIATTHEIVGGIGFG